MYIVFLVVLAIIFTILSVVGALKEKKRKDAVITEKMQCKHYIHIIALLWGATLAVFAMSFIGNVSFADIGFRQISFNYNIWFTAVTLALSVLALAFFMHKLIGTLVSEKIREKMEKQILEVEGVGGLLPRTKKEKRLWSLISFSAGTCEEIIYRGFLVFLLQAIFPDISVVMIILITFAAFGIAHLYQGLQGVIGTGVMGVLFMSLFLVTGSLILPMLLHFIIDFSSTFVLSERQV